MTPLLPIVIAGSWTRKAATKGVYAVLHSQYGSVTMIDQKALELAAGALGCFLVPANKRPAALPEPQSEPAVSPTYTGAEAGPRSFSLEVEQ